MRIARFIGIGVTIFMIIPVAALAALSADIRVTDVRFSSDFDRATVSLSKASANVYVRYDLYVDGVIESGASGRAYNTTTTTIDGLRAQFIRAGGDAMYQLAFQACPQDDTTALDVLKYCGEKKFVSVNFRAEAEDTTESGFRDVPSSHPNADAIAYVKAEGIVDGYADGTFRPGNAINRAEFTKIITLYAFGQGMIDACGSKYLFPDLIINAWYTKYICRARDAHLVSGYPDGTFRPDQKINFAEAAKIITSASSQSSTDPRLPEVDPGAPWFETYVRFLADRNAIPTSIASLGAYISRAEMVEIMYRLDTGNDDKPSKTYEELASGSNSSWTVYTYQQADFSVQFPSHWQVLKDIDGSFLETIGFNEGQPHYGGGYDMGVSFIHKTDEVDSVATYREKFGGSVPNETLQNIAVNGQPAIRSVTPFQAPAGAASRTVYLETTDMIYILSSYTLSAEDESNFTKFYQSFKLLSSSSSFGLQYRLLDTPSTVTNYARNVVYRYSVTAPSSIDATIASQIFTLEGGRWSNPQLEIYSDANFTNQISTWTSDTNWTDNSEVEIQGVSRLTVPALQTYYFELSLDIGIPADMGFTVSVKHRDLAKITLQSE